MGQAGRYEIFYLQFMSWAAKMGVDLHMQIGMRAVKMVMIVLWFNHLGSCMFSLVSGLGADNSLANAYWLGLYWSTSTMFSVVKLLSSLVLYLSVSWSQIYQPSRLISRCC